MTKIRKAHLDDAQRISQIYGHYVKNTAVSFEYEPPTADEMRKRIEKTLERYPYLVAEDDGNVIGFAYAGPFKERQSYDWSCEASIYVAHDARGCGAGRMLYTALEDALGAMGIVNLYACIAYPRKEDEYLTTGSADFHAHLGFRQVGKFEQCARKFDRWYDMIWMGKAIGAHADDQPPVIWRSGQAQA